MKYLEMLIASLVWRLVRATLILIVALVLIVGGLLVYAGVTNPNSQGIMTEDQRIEQGVEPAQYPTWR